jgi:cell division protease FtsH
VKGTHRTLLLWVVLIGGLVVIWPLFANPDQPRTVPFSEFMADVRAGRVEKVDIKSNDTTGEYTYTTVRGEGQTREAQRKVSFGIVGEDITKELIDKNVRVSYVPDDQGGLLTSVLVTWLPMVFLLVVFFFFMRQLQASGGKAMSFGKSKARMLSESQNKVTFADVAGIDEAKDDCEEIIAFLKDPKKFQRLGGRIPKGVLLMGSPGTGKTLLARAIAGEAGVPFFSISGSDFVEMFVGVGASRVRDLFEQGKKSAPCIIFIDEIDAVGRHRGAGMGGGHDEREQTLNQLLVEMDGFESNEGVIIIAATNRPDVLDPAILRPGRFDRRIVVPRPDLHGRVGILAVHTRKTPLAADVDLEVIARGTPMFSGADLENLVNEAALLAARQDKDSLSMSDFELAKDKVIMGAERRSKVVSERDRKMTAFHEAGHALIGRLLPHSDPVHKVTIIPRGPAGGVTSFLPEQDRDYYSREWARARIAVALGGRIAEEIAFNELTSGAQSDYRQATSIARAMVTEWGMSEKLGPLAYSEREDNNFLGMSARSREYSEQTAQEIDAEVRQIIIEQYEHGKTIVAANRDKLDAIANALLDRETLDRDDLDAIMEGRPLSAQRRIVIPTYAEKQKKEKDKRPATSIFQPRPREIPSGG